MFGDPIHKRFLSTLLLGVYLFVALLSQNFHTHSSAEVFKEYKFLKTERSLKNAADISQYSDCLACHILHDGKYFHFQQPLIEKYLGYGLQSEKYFWTKNFCATKFFEINLRGPPSNFI